MYEIHILHIQLINGVTGLKRKHNYSDRSIAKTKRLCCLVKGNYQMTSGTIKDVGTDKSRGEEQQLKIK